MSIPIFLVSAYFLTLIKQINNKYPCQVVLDKLILNYH